LLLKIRICVSGKCPLSLFPFPSIISSATPYINEGVREHCQFLKQIEDAASLRKAIAYCFERANIPSLSKKEISDALSFVIVGAGPTGVYSYPYAVQYLVLMSGILLSFL
jgi:hypothetical protein